MTAPFHSAPPYSQLYLVGDNAPWVLSEEVRSVHAIATRLGIDARVVEDASCIRQQSIFYISRYALFESLEKDKDNRLGLAYFHGTPGTGYPEFDDMFNRLRARHQRISRVHVSYSEMEQLMIRTGMERSKIHRIPLAVAIEMFRFRNAEDRQSARAALDIPPGAFLVGSFQKDGNGWGEGLSPKLIKGPDVFLRVLAAVRQQIPGLMVLLTGPARGFVKNGLDQLGIPYRHSQLERYEDVARCYHALDAYVVASRQEGGPKAILESMASGVPLVTTRVGQAIDLVLHGMNGWMSASEDVDHLAAGLLSVHLDPSRWWTIVKHGRDTAEENSYGNQLSLWRTFFKGFVEMPEGPDTVLTAERGGLGRVTV
jgi:glycosyltransferase involved in cell wall biosynthesis